MTEGSDTGTASRAGAGSAGAESLPHTAVATLNSSFLVRCGNFFFRYRDAISPAVVLALLAVTRPRQAFASAGADALLDLAGILVSLAGQALRIAVIGYAYIVRGGKGRKVYAEDLVTAGFFATSRNPLYVGNVLLYFGLFLIWNSPWMYAIGVPCFLFLYSAIVAAEEDFLRRTFGAVYDAYCDDVPRWLPDLRRLSGALDGMAFNWRRVVLREYGTVAAWLLTTSMLLIAERLYFSSYQSEGVFIRAMLGFMSAVIVAWAVTRWLKLSKRLRA